MSAMMLKSFPQMIKRQQSAHARRRQSGKNRDGVDIALVENAKHDIDSDNGGENQHRFVGKRSLKACAVP